MHTLAPRFDNIWAIPFPSPVAPPVTRTVFPENGKTSGSSLNTLNLIYMIPNHRRNSLPRRNYISSNLQNSQVEV